MPIFYPFDNELLIQSYVYNTFHVIQMIFLKMLLPTPLKYQEIKEKLQSLYINALEIDLLSY